MNKIRKHTLRGTDFSGCLFGKEIPGMSTKLIEETNVGTARELSSWFPALSFLRRETSKTKTPVFGRG